jgi:hypothetical protein
MFSVDNTGFLNASSYAGPTPFSSLDLPVDKTRINISFIETNLDQQLGSHIQSELVIGNKVDGSRAFFGKGGFNYEGVIFQSYDGVSYFDKTQFWKESVKTPTDIWESPNAGELIYLGDDVKFSTMEYTCSAPIVIGAGGWILEYYDGAVWQPVDAMCLKRDPPFASVGNKCLNTVGTFIIHLDLKLCFDSTNWTKTTINGSNKYWIRSRIVSAITTVAALSNLKLFYDAVEISNTGYTLYLGCSRVYVNLPFDTNLLKSTKTGVAAPKDTNIWGGENVGIGKIFNTLNSTGNNDLGFIFSAPTNLDTSSAIRIDVLYISDSNAALQPPFDLTLRIGSPLIGTDIIYVSNPVGTPIRNLQTYLASVPLDQTNGEILQRYTFNAYQTELISRNDLGITDSLLMVNLQRNNTDTNTNDMVIIQISITYVSMAVGSLP